MSDRPPTSLISVSLPYLGKIYAKCFPSDWCLCCLKKSYLILPCSFLSLLLYLNITLQVPVHQWRIGWVFFNTSAVRCNQKCLTNPLSVVLPVESTCWAWRASRSTQKEVNDFLSPEQFPFQRSFLPRHPRVLLPGNAVTPALPGARGAAGTPSPATLPAGTWPPPVCFRINF